MKNRRTLDYDGLDGVLLSADRGQNKPRWYKTVGILLIIFVLMLGVFFAEKLSRLPAAITEAEPPQAGPGKIESDLESAAISAETPKTSNSPAAAPISPLSAAPTPLNDSQVAQDTSVAQEQSIAQPLDSPPKTLFTVYFKFSSSKLTLLNPEQTRELLSAAQSCPGKIQLTGHTCNLGTNTSNQLLGLARAKAVANWLVTKGIARKRIVTASEGMQKPSAPNDTRVGQALNRRTELSCLDQ